MSCRFVSVAVGPYHTLAICQLDESNGANVGTTKIASWGLNRHGVLGRLDYDGFPGLIDGLDGENPVSVSAGFSHSLALTSKGKLWVWGSGSNGALGFKSPEKRYEPYYLDSLEGDGTLLSCGENSNGHLGRGIYGEECGLDPIEMSFRFVSVAVGPCHTLAICQLDESNGANVGTTKIASWGFNRHGALGRLDYDGFPGLIDGLDGENPVLVSAGYSHSLALTSKGKLWVWGSGSNGALGFKSPKKHYEPYYLDSLEGFQILQVVAGYNHNLVLVAD